ncbi:MAG: hypothetical protein M3392_01865 [Actinomycetota bacterium]|nr:hypothetical protein [Actinomycetota bacterium]
MSNAAKQGPTVSGSQVMGAGVAAAAAALVTSKFGVAGTLLGAALTAMIITGGSAILKAYLESVTGRVRKVPGKIRTRRERPKAGRYAEEPSTIPGHPELLNNFAGRMRAAMDWFSHLPPLTRRSILVKGLIAAAVAFVIGMGAVFAFEKVINNSLSCGLWATCPEGARPGIHILGGETGAGTTLAGGRAKTEAAPRSEILDPGGRQVPGSQQDYQQPAPPGDEQSPGIFEPDRPAESETPPEPVEPEPVEPEPVEPEPVEPEPVEPEPEAPVPGQETPPQQDPSGGTVAPDQETVRPRADQPIPAQ